jgi:hypothetical protein
MEFQASKNGLAEAFPWTNGLERLLAGHLRSVSEPTGTGTSTGAKPLWLEGFLACLIMVLTGFMRIYIPDSFQAGSKRQVYPTLAEPSTSSVGPLGPANLEDS